MKEKSCCSSSSSGSGGAYFLRILCSRSGCSSSPVLHTMVKIRAWQNPPKIKSSCDDLPERPSFTNLRVTNLEEDSSVLLLLTTVLVILL
ncbi:hypothetical protein E2C01_036722 [Portunus trituberculatus]|uniref:Uncharacterized protein n=1 Tax=Portunus trituberculatus TaxID=210409 RepID=A0A5B7FC53_PORTR|nr:hypothetical protein [Portunus trituberculatus]